MTTQELLDAELTPFQNEQCNIPYFTRTSEKMKICMLNLLVVYYAKLFQLEDIMEFPLIDAKYLWDGRLTEMLYSREMEIQLKNFFETVLSALPRWSSFRCHIIDLSFIEKQTNVKWQTLLEMNNRKRKQFLWEPLKQHFGKEEKALFHLAPEPILDSMDFTFWRKAVYFYSERLLKYLDFSKHNPDVVNRCFAKGHEKILQVIKTMETPLIDEDIKAVFATDHRWIIGFCMGDGSGKRVTMSDFNWNFFVAMYILERLLDVADSLFHFEKKEEL